MKKLPKEPKLNRNKLRQILNKINADPKTCDIYNSKLNRLLNFLRKTTGFKIAAVKEGDRKERVLTRVQVI